MPNTLVVAAAQTGPVLSDDPTSMLPAAAALMAQAAERGVQIVTFSELFAAPFFPNRLEADFERWFVAPDGPFVSELRALSRKHGIAAIWPFAERAPEGNFNSALVCDERGAVVGTYRKTHIPGYFPDDRDGGTGSYERMYFRPGADLNVFDWHGARFGIQICNDRLYPEASRVLAIRGADIIFMPICYSTYSDPKHRSAIWDVSLRARAYENGVYVVAANRVGREGARQHLGRSMVVDPTGSIVAEAGTEGDELLVATIDLDLATRARKKIPWWRDRRPELYADLVR